MDFPNNNQIQMESILLPLNLPNGIYPPFFEPSRRNLSSFLFSPPLFSFFFSSFPFCFFFFYFCSLRFNFLVFDRNIFFLYIFFAKFTNNCVSLKMCRIQCPSGILYVLSIKNAFMFEEIFVIHCNKM